MHAGGLPLARRGVLRALASWEAVQWVTGSWLHFSPLEKEPENEGLCGG